MKITHQHYLSDREQQQLATNLQSASPLDKLLVETALATGGRASEVLALAAKDLYIADDEGKELHIVFITGLKGSDDRGIPVQPELWARLVAAATANGGKCFKVGYKYFYAHWCKVRPVKKRLHSTRHTFAVNLYKKTKDIRLVQVALGHRSIANTEAYTKLQITTSQLAGALL